MFQTINNHLYLSICLSILMPFITSCFTMLFSGIILLLPKEFPLMFFQGRSTGNKFSQFSFVCSCLYSFIFILVLSFSLDSIFQFGSYFSQHLKKPFHCIPWKVRCYSYFECFCGVVLKIFFLPLNFSSLTMMCLVLSFCFVCLFVFIPLSSVEVPESSVS